MRSRVPGFWLPEDVRYRQKYVCLWMKDDGHLVSEGEERYLSAESFTKGDPVIEAKMAHAAKDFGIDGGRPYWIEGEKVTDSEKEIQMERLAAGLIPSEKEEMLIALEDEYINRAKKRPTT